MVDKIVQLVDKDDNNVYPVAGSLKQGSVTTGTINDGAVTPSKIDMSALENALYGASVSTTTVTLQRTDGSGTSSTHTIKKINLGGDVFVYTGRIGSDNVGSVSTGLKEYTLRYNEPFDEFYGAAFNGFAIGHADSFMRYCSANYRNVDFYIDHKNTNEKIGAQFILIGAIAKDAHIPEEP